MSDSALATPLTGIEVAGVHVRRRLLAHHLAERWAGTHVSDHTPALVYRFDRRSFPGSPADALRRILPLAALHHRHLLAIEDAELTSDGALWVTSPYPGGAAGVLTLSNVLSHKEQGFLDPAETGCAARHLLEALAHAHASGIIHGSLRMDDVLVNPRGSVLIELFGVASALRKALPSEPNDPLTDLRAVGGIVLELMTGVPTQSSPELLEKVLGRRGVPWTRWLERMFGGERAFSNALEALASLPA